MIVDRSRDAVYLMKRPAGIDAVAVSSGELLWTTTDGAKPLLLDGNLLVAQSEARRAGLLSIVGLDASARGLRLFAADAPLPDGVTPSIDARLDTSFVARARARDGAVIVSWRALRQSITGARPLPGEGPEDRQDSGSFSIDIQTGRVEPLTEPETSAATQTLLPDNVRRLLDSGRITGPVWQPPDLVASVERARDDPSRILLQRWRSDTGQALADVTLFRDDLFVQHASADERHLLATRAIAGQQHLWSIFSLETGDRVAEVRTELPGAAFCIAGERLIHEVLPRPGVPAAIRAIDLATSTERWVRRIRDTAFLGGQPPGPPDDPGRPRQAAPDGHSDT